MKDSKSDVGSVSGKSSMSVLTGKTTSGAINKHCSVQGCTTKKVILGSHWSRHVKLHTDKGMDKKDITFNKCEGENC